MSAVINSEGMTLEQSWERMRLTALKVKAERDEYEAVIRDIRLGAEMMLQPACGLKGAMLGYVKEVHRVCNEALKP